MSGNDYLIKILKPSEFDVWDELVDESPMGTIFSYSEWLQKTSEALNTNVVIYGCYQKDNLVGGCPLFTTRIKSVLKMGSNIAGMMPYSGIIINDYPQENVRKYERHQNAICDSLRTVLENLKLPYISIINPIKLCDIRDFTWKGWKSSVYYTYLLDLNNLNYSRDVRRNIKQAISNEVFVEESYVIVNYFS